MIVKYCEVTILEVGGSISVGLASCGMSLGGSNFLDYNYDIGMLHCHGQQVHYQIHWQQLTNEYATVSYRRCDVRRCALSPQVACRCHILYNTLKISLVLHSGLHVDI